jgi:hypothetical protein
MKLYLISQGINTSWDTYDSAVVVAMTADKAKQIHPSGYENWDSSSWANSPDEVAATQIGTANEYQKEGSVICASFTAG